MGNSSIYTCKKVKDGLTLFDYISFKLYSKVSSNFYTTFDTNVGLLNSITVVYIPQSFNLDVILKFKECFSVWSNSSLFGWFKIMQTKTELKTAQEQSTYMLMC